MDDRRFDHVTRLFAASSSRRTLVRRLTAVLAASAGLAASGADARSVCRIEPFVCRKNGDCCTGFCKPRDRTGRRRCGCPEGQANCSEVCSTLASDPLNCGQCGNACPGQECSSPTCALGICGLVPDPSQDGQSCAGVTGSLCDGGDCKQGGGGDCAIDGDCVSDVCCEGVCCASAGSVCLEEQCCETGVICGIDGTKCCAAGTICVSDSDPTEDDSFCCPAGVISCNGVCCQSVDATCLAGQCCETGINCGIDGTKCCPAGTVCVGDFDPTEDDFFCCVPGVISCNGICCQSAIATCLAGQCCATGVACGIDGDKCCSAGTVCIGDSDPSEDDLFCCPAGVISCNGVCCPNPTSTCVSGSCQG